MKDCQQSMRRKSNLPWVVVFAILTTCHSFIPLVERRELSSLYMYMSTSTPCHHLAIKTRDIEMAINFYSLLDFEVETKFLAGNARAAWLQQRKDSRGVMIELIEVPSYMLNESKDGPRRRALDLINQHPNLLGLNHYAIDVTQSMKSKGMKRLQEWIDSLQKKSLEKFGKKLRIAVEPREQMIGQYLYQLAFIYDADGALVELLYQQRRYKQEMISGWYV